MREGPREMPLGRSTKYHTQQFEFATGLTLNIKTLDIRDNYIESFEIPSGWFSFWVCFSGIKKGIFHETNDNIVFNCGRGGIFAGAKNLKGKSIIPTGNPFKFLSVHVPPTVLSEVIGGEEYATLPKSCHRIVDGKSPGIFFRSKSINPMIRLILEQMLNCSFENGIKKLYLEGKSFELIAYLLQLIKNKTPFNDRSCHVDIDRIYYAERLLLRDMANPPSLMVLARSAGLHHTKLNLGFKNVFGSTVFDHLRNIRLKKAADLLLDGKMNCAEVSFFVGYSNLSYFAKAFKKQFGVTPSSFRNYL